LRTDTTIGDQADRTAPCPEHGSRRLQSGAGFPREILAFYNRDTIKSVVVHNMMRHLLILPALLAASAFFGPTCELSFGIDENIRRIHADIMNREGQKIGDASLTQTTGGVVIHARIKQLPPGTHAIYIHAVGKCEGPDFMSAGAQFDPFGIQGGKPAGDSPNFNVDASGQAIISVLSRGVTSAHGRPNSVFHEGGTAIVIHEQAYDYKAHRTGNPGRRLACGLITMTGSGSSRP
jgi:Cu-Zn family superoxide dismutase